MTTLEELRERVVEDWVKDALPSVLPPTWAIVEETEDGRKYYNSMLQFVVIISGQTEQDGKRWLHFSMSNRYRVPKWHEFVEAKEMFLGTEKYAYQVIPPRSKYVNINPNVLHLWCCLDGEPLPDFTWGSESL